MSVAVSMLRQVGTGASAPRDRRATRDWVLRQLYEWIFSGDIKPGVPLSETDLAQRVGVSRQPIREALRQLESDGLIEEAAGNGARAVVVFEKRHITEIYSIRAALESVSFRAACSRITDEQLADLERVQAELEGRLRHGAPDPGKYDAAPDFRFHEIVAEAAGMPQLHAFLVNVWIKTWALLNQVQLAGTYPNEREIADSYRDRRLLLDLLRERDAERAAAAVVTHVNRRKTQLTAAIDSGRGGFRLPGVSSPGQAAVFA
ncbi:GntR family transcriptional regulator [Streptomyces sp. NPDC047085]|uniref:GntR family transcriptional regulator n=1 Tax=Streptomyces sp. NPDC047085 TaxID=3155140 RepID=UPI0033E64AAC